MSTIFSRQDHRHAHGDGHSHSHAPEVSSQNERQIFLAMLLTWMAFRLSRRPADDHRSYGYYRGEVLAAFIMMEGTPAAIDYQAIKDDLLENIEGLEHVHHMHIWALTQERPGATLHARISENSDGEKMLHRIHARLKAEHRIDHSTIQIERGDCP